MITLELPITSGAMLKQFFKLYNVDTSNLLNLDGPYIQTKTGWDALYDYLNNLGSEVVDFSVFPYIEQFTEDDLYDTDLNLFEVYNVLPYEDFVEQYITEYGESSDRELLQAFVVTLRSVGIDAELLKDDTIICYNLWQ